MNPFQRKITDFIDEKEQLLDISDSLAAGRHTNGEFVRGESKNVKRRRK